ncbi:hypothetical protein AB6A40_002964 [Gnathostoma spinigerum]|uniref:SAM domain-containing protein n=1 Tax=Gnathostoma spinigerum TaxID=75299 RepID=A0ABD6E9B2_9BILA
MPLYTVGEKNCKGIAKACSSSPNFASANIELNGSVELWSYKDVAHWLTSRGFEKYSNLLAVQHKIDGSTLLMLRESDLREKPLELNCLGDIKRLASAISELKLASAAFCETRDIPFDPTSSANSSAAFNDFSVRNSSNKELVLKNSPICASFDENRSLQSSPTPCGSKSSGCFTEIVSLGRSYSVRRLHLISRDDLIRKVESPDTNLKAFIKLVIAFFYCTLSLLLTAFVMVLVHDRVPDMKTYPPLPDIVLDNLPHISWAFEVCEIIGVVLSTIWFTVLFFHKHRVVILRRMFSLVGTVFLLRCITMLITSLSVPGSHLECRANEYTTLSAKLKQAFHIWSGLGMSINDVRTCGDYMFSGHTTAITLLNHFVTEYTPENWHGLHTATWVLNLFGIFFILAGHEHYSIDVFIAFYISSRMFLYYHAYAYNAQNAHDGRMRTWFPLGWFFEAGGQGRVPNDFEFPLFIPVFSTTPLEDFLKRVWSNCAVSFLHQAGRERLTARSNDLNDGSTEERNGKTKRRKTSKRN